MTCELPDDVQKRVTTLLEQSYDSVDDVFRNALGALERERIEISAIQEGIDDMDAGRYRPLDDVDAEIRAKHNFPPDP